MIILLAAIFEDEPKKRLLSSAFGLWWMTVAIGVVLVVTVWIALAARRGRRLSGRGKHGKRRPIPDAWAEAGRRVEPIRMDEPEPPTAPEL